VIVRVLATHQTRYFLPSDFVHPDTVSLADLYASESVVHPVSIVVKKIPRAMMLAIGFMGRSPIGKRMPYDYTQAAKKITYSR